MRDRWPPLARFARAATARPEPLLRLLGAPEPVWRDGRRLDRGIQLLLALGERTGATDDVLDPQVMRRDMRRLTRLGSPSRQAVHVWDRRIDGPGGPLPLRIYRPHDAPAVPGCIVYAHGGGFVVGDLDTHDPTCRHLAADSGCIVVAVDYRLAPEHPFPAAVDDVVAAYEWMLGQADALGVAATPPAVMGDSAGATLIAALCLEARRLGLPQPAVQVLVYPLTDARLLADSYRTFAEGFGLTTAQVAWFRDQYLRSPDDWTDPRASPLCAADHAGLASAIVHTAGFDVLRDDGAAYAEALRAAGGEAELRCADDLIHGFHGMLVHPAAAAMATALARELGRRLIR